MLIIPGSARLRHCCGTTLLIAALAAILVTFRLGPSSRRSIRHGDIGEVSSLRRLGDSVEPGNASEPGPSDDASNASRDENASSPNHSGNVSNSSRNGSASSGGTDGKPFLPSGDDPYAIFRSFNNSCGSYGGSADDFDMDQWRLVCEWLNPPTLKPLYLLPVEFGTKTLVTFLAFGLDLRFKPRGDPTWLDTVKKVGKAGFGALLIGMALNCYYQDITAFVSAPATNFGQRAAAALVVWVTSPNYIAAKSVWSAFKLQAPSRLLGVKPNYPALGYGVPLVLGAAKWLDPVKHFYALLLFPYELLALVAVCAMCGVCCVWSCMTRCACWLGLLGHYCCSCIALVGVVVTFGMWGWAKSTYKDSVTLTMILMALYAFNYYVVNAVPWGMGALYSTCAGASCSSFWEAVCLIKETTYSLTVEGQQTHGLLDEHRPQEGYMVSEAQVAALRRFNYDTLEGDFEGLGDPADPEAPHEAGGPQSFHVPKICIYILTVKSMAVIAYMQAFFPLLLRTFYSSTADGYAQAIVVTLAERQFTTWIDHMTSAASDFSDTLYLIWDSF